MIQTMQLDHAYYCLYHQYTWQGFFQKISQEGAKPGFGEIWGGQSRIEQHAIKGGLGVLPQKIFGI